MATVYEIVTDKIIMALKSGVVPWHRPWSAGTPHTSLVTMRPYRGVNVLLLTLSALSNGFESPYWLSLNQAKKLGIRVKYSEMRNSTLITFWLKKDKKEDSEENSEEPESAEKASTRFILRYYLVWNLDQCEPETVPASLKAKFKALENNQLDQFSVNEVAERIVTGMPNPPTMRSVEDRAYYSPALDIDNIQSGRRLFLKAVTIKYCFMSWRTAPGMLPDLPGRASPISILLQVISTARKS